jgi:ERF superfamily protein
MNEASMPTNETDFGGLQYIPTTPDSEISDALAKAQGGFGPVTRDKTVTVTMKSGGKYTFSYAPLESILHAVRPALSKNGLALTQAMVVCDGKDFVETTLRHSSGQVISNRIPLFVKDDGPQAYGSALTYARRYGVTLLLCISADDDDDGNAAEGNSAQQKEKAISTAAKLLASNFQAALKAGIDGRINDVHLKHNADQELYLEAWQLLTPAERREIKAAIERVRNPNTNREPAEA